VVVVDAPGLAGGRSSLVRGRAGARLGLRFPRPRRADQPGLGGDGAEDRVARRVARLALGSLPATAITLVILGRLDARGGGASELVNSALSIVLVMTGVTLILRKKIIARYADSVASLTPRRISALTILTGAVLGVCASLSSIGAGAIGIIALIVLFPKLSTDRVVGTDLAHGVPLSLLAGLGHWALGTVDWHLVTVMLVGSVPGIALGSLVATRVPDTVLRMVLALALIFVGGRLVF